MCVLATVQLCQGNVAKLAAPFVRCPSPGRVLVLPFFFLALSDSNEPTNFQNIMVHKSSLQQYLAASSVLSGRLSLEIHSM